MIDLDGTLSELARLHSGSEPIVSLYLDARWRDEHQRERARVFVQEESRRVLAHYADGTPGKDALARTLEKVRGFVEGLAARVYEAGGQSVALFANESLNLWRPLFLARPLREELRANGVPHLSQLARAAADLAPVLVVVPDRDGADLYEVALGEIGTVTHLHGEPPAFERAQPAAGPAGAPGRRAERDDRDRRRSAEWTRRNHRAAVEVLAARVDGAPRASIVLVGTSRTVAAFERELPERLRARVAARLPRPRAWTSANGTRLDGVRAFADEAARTRRDGPGPDAVIGEALRGGVGVVGPEDVVLALNEGRVHTLVVEEDFERTGWRCDNCAALGASVDAAEVCPFCAGDLRAVPRLGEALVARTIAEGGRVEVVPHDTRLHAYRGVAALLRQTAPTGLRGASPPWAAGTGADQS